MVFEPVSKLCFRFWDIIELFLCIIRNLGTYVWALEVDI
jgi:hypothetical protein